MLWKTVNKYEEFTLAACLDSQALAKIVPNKEQPSLTCSMLSCSDFMMILYSLIVCSIPRNGCCSFRVGLEVEPDCAGFFQSFTPSQGSVVPCR